MPSSGEIFVILLVVFILFGGKGLKEVARTMGKWTRKIQNASREFQRELNLDEFQREVSDDLPRLERRTLEAPETKSEDDSAKPSDPDKPELKG
jgi:TatA/E family protein of Tat protein translocase